MIPILFALAAACSETTERPDPSIDASVCPPARTPLAALGSIDAGPAGSQDFVDAGVNLHAHEDGFRHLHADAGADAATGHGGGGIKDRCWPLTADWVAHHCPYDNWRRPVCADPVQTDIDEISFNHIELPTEINYEHSPPSSGNHRPQWAVWGEYGFLPAQRWLHNAEHGGVVLLYHPCAAPQTIDALRAFAQSRPPDADGEPFRYILTPYPDLVGEVAAVAWTHSLVMNCYDPSALSAFAEAYHRRAPEDIAAEGAYDFDWLGR